MPRRRKRRLRRPDASTKTGPSEASAVAGAPLPGWTVRPSAPTLALSSWTVTSCGSWPPAGSPEFSREPDSGRPSSGRPGSGRPGSERPGSGRPGSGAAPGRGPVAGPSLKKGRVRTVHMEPNALMAAESWLIRRRQELEAQLDRFEQHLATLKGSD